MCAFDRHHSEEIILNVTLLNDVSLLVDDKYRAHAKAKWVKQNPGKDAATCGHLVKTVPVEGRDGCLKMYVVIADNNPNL